MKTTHQVGDRVKVMHNIPLGNLIGTVKAIHQRPRYDVYEVELDGGGTDQLYDFQLEMITDTPETDAQVKLLASGGDRDDYLHSDFARKLERARNHNRICVERLERERNDAREAYEAETLSTAEMARRIAELERDKAHLIEKGETLVRWVESNRHHHEEIRDHNGRLKDTGIWAQFYVAVRGIQRKDTPKPSCQNA